MPTAPLNFWRALTASALNPLAWSSVALAFLLGLGACATGADAFDDDSAAAADAATVDAAMDASTVTGG